MSRAQLLGYLALSFVPLAAIAVVCGVGAVVAVERYGVRQLWTLWLLVATTTSICITSLCITGSRTGSPPDSSLS